MAYDFDGTNDGISLGNSSALNPTTFSISGWMNADNWAGGGSGLSSWLLARDDETDGRSFAFGVAEISASVRKLVLQINGTNRAISTTNLNAVLGVWKYFTCIGTSGNWKVYIDGSQDGTDTTVVTPGTTTGATTIGYRTYSGFENYANARIAEVGFWDVLLDASEIISLSHAFSPLCIRPGNLLSYVPLVRSLVDYVGAAPTLVDAPTAGFAHPRIYIPKGRQTRKLRSPVVAPALRAQIWM